MALKLRIEPYDPDAIDADNDGIVQEGTAWERPAGSRLLDEIGNDIQRGITSMSRPSMRVVGSDGADITYKPSYGSAGNAKKRGKPSPLGKLGYPSLSEGGLSLGSSSLEEIGYPALDAQVPNIQRIIDQPRPYDEMAQGLNNLLLKLPQEDLLKFQELNGMLGQKLAGFDKGSVAQVLAINAAYWTTYLTNFGGLGTIINDMSTGVMDTDQAEHLATLVAMFKVGGKAAIDHTMTLVKEKWGESKERIEEFKKAFYEYVERMKVKAGELSDSLKNSLSSTLDTIQDFLKQEFSFSPAVGRDIGAIRFGGSKPDTNITQEPAEDFEDAFGALARGLPQDQRVPIRINRNRAFKRADEKAQELAFTSGDHYVVETDKEILVLSKRDYEDFINRIGGSGNVPDGVDVMRYGKPKAQFAGAEEAKAELIGPTRVSTIDDEKYRNAVADIHYGSGDVADLDDDIFAAAIFDENLVIDETSGLSILNPQGVDMTFEDIMTGNFDASAIDNGVTFENKRFKFKALKGNQGKDSVGGHEYGGLWSVFKVEDKETGEIWYLKASTFGSNDGILENIGMEASAVLELAARNDPKEIRTGTRVPVVDPQSPDWNNTQGRSVRWTAMRSIESWDTTVPLKTQMDDEGETLFWRDSGDAGGIDADNVSPEDVSQILALDYIFDNLDRHEFNVKIAYDDKGDQRLGVIDNGLMFGGRASELMSIGYDVEVSGAEFDEHALYRKDMSPTNYATSAGNIFFNYLSDFGTRIFSDDEAMERFNNGQKLAVERIRAQIDQIFSLDRLRSRGIELTPTEEAHINAMRTLAMTRLKYLEDNPGALTETFSDLGFGASTSIGGL
jgi:hypothetical protein